jgi:hypothetical protein
MKQLGIYETVTVSMLKNGVEYHLKDSQPKFNTTAVEVNLIKTTVNGIYCDSENGFYTFRQEPDAQYREERLITPIEDMQWEKHWDDRDNATLNTMSAGRYHLAYKKHEWQGIVDYWVTYGNNNIIASPHSFDRSDLGLSPPTEHQVQQILIKAAVDHNAKRQQS